MYGLKDYLDWRGDLSMFTNLPCEVDLLIFAQLVHAPLERITELHGQCLNEMTEEIYPVPPKSEEGQLPSQRYALWKAVEKSERYRDVTIKRFVSRFDAVTQKQFAAAFFCTGKIGFVAFRGTDATLIGWKEDFNLAFEEEIPAQQEAVDFLNNVGESCDYLYVCGHSKGGNLAMYASAMCREEVKKRILYIANFDGPGMTAGRISSPQWLSVKNRIHVFVPESSVVGMLFTTGIEPVIIKSDSAGILQHNPYFWHIMGCKFVLSEQTTITSKIMDHLMNYFINNSTLQQKRTLVDTLYELLSVSEAKYIREILPGLTRHSKEAREIVKKLTSEDKRELAIILRLFIEALQSSLLSNGRDLISISLFSSITDKLPQCDGSSSENPKEANGESSPSFPLPD